MSETLPNGGSEFWFNFVFAWWFTVPLSPVDEEPPTPQNLTHPCAKCGQLFQHEWEVSRHYIDTHVLGGRPPAPPVKAATPPPVRLPTPPPPPPPREETPELLHEPPPWWEEIIWAWEDFLPLWELPFLPTPVRYRWDSLTILCEEEKEATPPPPPPPPQKSTPPPPPVTPPPKRVVVSIPAPVLKQTKYHCRTCNLTICNTCFTRQCSAHNVDFKGTAKFSCGAC